MDQVNAYQIQNNWLNGLFAVLPQLVLGVIGLLRFIVSVPLIIGGVEMFEFFDSSALAVIMSVVVVIALEVIGLLASLLTAYFRSAGMQEAFWISLGIGLFSMLFNAFLLKSIENLEVSFVAQIVFQAFNALSFGLGEAVGFLVVSVRKSEKPIEKDLSIDVKYENDTLTSELVAKLKNEGKTHQEIADKYQTNISKVSRLLKAV